MTKLLGKRVTLKPLEDKDYFLDLADKDNKHEYPREQIASMLNEYGGEFWDIWLNGTKRGVVGYFKFNDVVFMEALKDHSTKTPVTISLEVGRLVLDYLFTLTDRVMTCAREKEPAIQILCKKLGFKESHRKDNLIYYEKEK